MKTEERYNEVDILYTLMTYVNVSSNQDMYYTIAHTILTHLDRIPNIAINDLADLCYTSPATISRFCKDLNCKNFASFKKELALALELARDEIHFDDSDLKKLGEDPRYLIDKVYNDSIDALKMGLESVNMFEIDKICRMIHDASKVHFYGYQFNKIVASNFQLKLLKLKKLIYNFAERGDEIQRLDLIDKDSLVVIMSVSAKENLIEGLYDKIKDTKAKILLITLNKSYTNNKLDFIYYLNGKESDYTQSSLMGSICFESFLNVIYIRYGLLYKGK